MLLISPLPSQTPAKLFSGPPPPPPTPTPFLLFLLVLGPASGPCGGSGEQDGMGWEARLAQEGLRVPLSAFTRLAPCPLLFPWKRRDPETLGIRMTIRQKGLGQRRTILATFMAK